jgi:hypothetical protein
MSVPTKGEEFIKLMEHLRKAQEAAAMLSHLNSEDGSPVIAKGWLTVEELLKRTVHNVTQLATRGLH